MQHWPQQPDMSGKPSTANDKARTAYERSGSTLSAKELARRYKLAPSTIYRAAWFKKPAKQESST